MSNGIRDTPKKSINILALPLAEPSERKSIRVPCSTPEQGLEAIEMTDVYATMEHQATRITTAEGTIKTHTTDISSIKTKNTTQDTSINNLTTRITTAEGTIKTHTSDISGIKTKNTTQDTSIANLTSRIASLESRTIEQMFPVGYYHIQHDVSTNPNVLYPKATWSDITGAYIGKYFMPSTSYNSGSILAAGLPNITGNFFWGGSTEGTLSNSFYNVSGYTNSSYLKASDGVAGSRSRFDASRSSSIYGSSSTVTPPTWTIKIWRKTGNITGYSSFALIDDEGVYQDIVEIGEDEAGLIGYNPNIHIDILPPKSLHAKSYTHDDRQVLAYDREAKTWQMMSDNRGRIAYKSDGTGSRVIHNLGEDLESDETWDEPQITNE